MIVTPNVCRYDVILQNKYFLRECIQSLTLEDRLDEVAYCGKVRLAVPDDQFTGLPIITPGMEIRISGTKFGEDKYSYLIHPGVVWNVEIDNNARRNWNLTIYDRTIYLSKSEGQFLFQEGTTASDRIKQICSEWNIPILNIPDTKQALAQDVVRAKSLWNIIQDQLKETAEKSGKLFTVRMQPDGLELFEIGSNSDPWVFEFAVNLQSVRQKQTLNGAVTKVKVLGKQEKGSTAPIEFETNADTDKYGTIQKVISYKKGLDTNAIEQKATNTLAGIQETVTVEAIDINTIRKGDKVIVQGWEDGLYVISVKHNCNSPGTMQMELASLEYIRRRYYRSEKSF
ncbi:XkdQ/YqbQ family protein [Megamonas funiformis]|jgi:hypothetical protein|uniref:XkdQ/YqbQ family protein n=1 Tax=Megamonas funiformis TaxID=437897 RepID=UPI002676FBFE|nr:hypothetical protein [Megamonas funiformis]